MKKLFTLCVAFLLLGIGCLTPEKEKAGYYSRIEALPYVRNNRSSLFQQIDLFPILLDHFSTPSPEGKKKKAIVVNYDGCRADVLSLLDPETSAVFRNASTGGLYLAFTGGVPGMLQKTRTSPGFTTQFTGMWAKAPGGHRVNNNGSLKNPDAKLSVNAIAERGYKTAFYYLWGAYDLTYAADKRYAKENELPVSFVRCYPKPEDAFDGDAELTRSVRQALTAGSPAEADFVVCILEETDVAGHHFGFSPVVPEYVDALKKIDAYGVEILETVQSRPDYRNEDWLILFSTDHGGLRLTHGGQSVYTRTIWISSNRPLTRPKR